MTDRVASHGLRIAIPSVLRFESPWRLLQLQNTVVSRPRCSFNVNSLQFWLRKALGECAKEAEGEPLRETPLITHPDVHSAIKLLLGQLTLRAEVAHAEPGSARAFVAADEAG